MLILEILQSLPRYIVLDATVTNHIARENILFID